MIDVERVRRMLDKTTSVNPELFEQQEEVDLYVALESKDAFKITRALEAFFDRVLVMSEDPDVRCNRLNLLRSYLEWHDWFYGETP